VRNERIVRWLEIRPAAPFFMWVQSMDVHEYDPPPPFAGRFTNPTGAMAASTPPGDSSSPGGRGVNLDDWTPAQLAAFGAMARVTPERYDETVAYADHQIGLLLDHMAKVGMLDDTIVIITADHGEPLWEHGQFLHGMNVFEEVVRVPLVVASPWDRTPRRIERVTSLRDIAPTILDLAGLTSPPSFEGRSLLAAPHPGEPAIAVGATQGFKQESPSWFLRTGPWKLVMDRDKTQLFHLASDPDETVDVAHRHAVTAQHLSSLLVKRSPEFRAGWQAPPPWDADLDAAQKTRLREALKALGYAE
jgi:arylsulfatase A-like enzyme